MKKFFILSFLVSLFFVSQCNAQWWVDGGNLIWPYGNVTVAKDLYVTGSIFNSSYNRVESNTATYVYIALLTQSGSDAPTAIIIENTFPDTITWSRPQSGIYNATLTGAFSLQTTIPIIHSNRVNGIDEWYCFDFLYVDNNTLSVTTTIADFTAPSLNYADGILNYTAVEIIVY